MLIAPVGAIGREIFSVYENTLVTFLVVSDSIYLQVLSRNSQILQSDSTEDISSIEGLVNRSVSPYLMISSYQELSTFEYLMTGYPKPRSERDMLG